MFLSAALRALMRVPVVDCGLNNVVRNGMRTAWTRHHSGKHNTGYGCE